MATPERMREIQRLGAEAMRKRHLEDPTFFSRLGRLGAAQQVGKKRKPGAKRKKKPTPTPKPPTVAAPVVRKSPVAPAAAPARAALDVLDAILGGQ